MARVRGGHGGVVCQKTFWHYPGTSDCPHKKQADAGVLGCSLIRSEHDKYVNANSRMLDLEPLRSEKEIQ